MSDYIVAEDSGLFDPVTKNPVGRVGVDGVERLSKYLGPVANGTNIIENFSTGGNWSLVGRTCHVAYEDIDAIAVVGQQYRIVPVRFSGGDGPLNEQTDFTEWSLAIEYPPRNINRIPLTVNGRLKGQIPKGGILQSDIVKLPFTIKAGSVFGLVQRFYNSGGVLHRQDLTTALGYGGIEGGYTAASTIDYTLPGPDFLPSSLTGNARFIHTPPAAVLGWTTRPTFIEFGDSRSEGTAAFDDMYKAKGQIEPSMSKMFGYIKVGKASEFLQYIMDNPYKYAKNRMELAKYASHVICQLGCNDLADGAFTAASHIANMKSFCALFPEKPVYWGTIGIRNSSSNGWVDSAGQTVNAAYDAKRIPVNDAIRQGQVGAAGYVEIADAVETARNSGIWVSPGITNDGVHETLAGMKLIENSNGFRRLLSLSR